MDRRISERDLSLDAVGQRRVGRGEVGPGRPGRFEVDSASSSTLVVRNERLTPVPGEELQNVAPVEPITPAVAVIGVVD